MFIMAVTPSPYGGATSPPNPSREDPVTPEQDARLRFRQWLIDHELDPEVAYAILESMPPFDWSEIARRDEMLLRFSDVDQRFNDVDRRFDTVDQRFNDVDRRLDTVDRRLDTVDRRFDTVDQRFNAMDRRFDTVDAQLEGVGAKLDGFGARLDGSRSVFEGQLLAMEGRLSLRWMETTRILVFAMITLFLAVTGVAVGLLNL